jgi:protein arginine kinase activator
MLCEKCGQKPATTLIKHTINGKMSVHNVCYDCAKNIGAFNLFNDLNFNLNNLFSGMFSPDFAVPSKNETEAPQVVCPKCGISLNEITHIGKVGCDECYTYFYNNLIPAIEKIHGKATHTGKIPKSAGKAAKIKNVVSKLKTELATAIANEDFEAAAKLRDEIKTYQSEVGNDE